MTAHRGYTIKYPREFGHRHRKAIKIVALWLRRAVRGAETVGGFAGNVSSHPGNLITWGLMSLQLKLSNKSRLQRAGFDFDCVYTPHLVTEEHQRKALEELLHESAASSGERNITGDLRGIVRENGETIWVCDQCHDCIQRGLPIVESNILTLPQYLPLVRRGPKVEVTLHNTTSVSIFTETFIKPSKTEEMIIHIDPTYFEAPERSTGAPFNSIVQLFEELGQALQGQKSLKRLEIHCNSQSGEMYSGLKAVFNCRSLESLVVSGIPCFLQNHIPMKFRRLKDLTFQGVNVAMGAAAANFKAMRIMNPGLLVLVI
ncbi:hypothetical protein BGX31_010536 [Mortierella sp. GBA43]|nr:hypothetical protein BGX31_010536 [Mortierella sp. GBA43]